MKEQGRARPAWWPRLEEADGVAHSHWRYCEVRGDGRPHGRVGNLANSGNRKMWLAVCSVQDPWELLPSTWTSASGHHEVQGLLKGALHPQGTARLKEPACLLDLSFIVVKIHIT